MTAFGMRYNTLDCVLVVLCIFSIVVVDAFRLESLFLFRRSSSRRVSQPLNSLVMTSNPSIKNLRMDPPQELVGEALLKAAELIRDAGGCIDSISFGTAWKKKYPDFPRERFDGTSITSFNKLIRVFAIRKWNNFPSILRNQFLNTIFEILFFLRISEGKILL